MTVLLLAFCHYLLLKQYLISVTDGAARTTIIPLCNQRDDVSLGVIRKNLCHSVELNQAETFEGRSTN